MVKRKEPGGGATSYAFYFIVIIIAIVIFMYLRFNALLYVLEHEVETNLHILESATITVNQDDVESGDREDKYGKEIDRKHIITAEMKNGTGLNTDEEKQLKAVGDYFSKAFVEKFKLEGNLHPSEGILKEICGPSASIRIGTVRIVEPFYQYNSQNEVELGDDKISLPELDGKDHDFLGDDQDKLQVSSSNIEIVGWKEYELHFDDNNNFTSVTVTGTYAADEAPKFLEAKNKKKKEVNGATIEATALIDFNGIKNVFANMAMEEPEISGAVEFNEEGKITRNNFNIDYKGTDKTHLFADNPSYLHYDVKVTEAYDIVIAKDLKKGKPKDDSKPTPDTPLLPGSLSWTSRVWTKGEGESVVHPIFNETYFKNTFTFEYEEQFDDIISKFNGQTIEFYPLDYHNYLNWTDENVDAAREKLSDVDYSNYTGYEIDLRDDSGAILVANEEEGREFHYTSDTLDTEFLYGVIELRAVKDTYDLNGNIQRLWKLHHDDYDYNLEYWDTIDISYIVPVEDMSKIAELLNFYNEWKSKEPSDDIEDEETAERLWGEYHDFYNQKINEIMDDHGVITLSNGYKLTPIKIVPRTTG